MQRPNDLPKICKYLPPLVCPGKSRSYTGSRIIETSSFLHVFFVNRNHIKAKKNGPTSRFLQKKFSQRQVCVYFFHGYTVLRLFFAWKQIGEFENNIGGINANVCVQFLSKSPMCQGRQKKVFETKQKKRTFEQLRYRVFFI